MSTLEVSATWDGGLAATIHARGHTLKVDEPLDAGGADTGPMPTELLCAALAGCFCLAIGHVAGKREIEVPGLTVTVGAERAGRELRYERLAVTVTANLDRRELDALVERAKRFCWVTNTLAAGVDVVYNISTKLDEHPLS